MPSRDSFETVSVIVTHFRTPDILDECLRRLFLYAKDAEIIVVDSGQDGTVERLAERHPELNVLAVSNHSMAHLVNEGLKQSSKPYILQMNKKAQEALGSLAAAIYSNEKP